MRPVLSRPVFYQWARLKFLLMETRHQCFSGYVLKGISWVDWSWHGWQLTACADRVFGLLLFNQSSKQACDWFGTWLVSGYRNMWILVLQLLLIVFLHSPDGLKCALKRLHLCIQHISSEFFRFLDMLVSLQCRSSPFESRYLQVL